MDTRIATAEWADPALVEQNYTYHDGTVWLGRSASEHQVGVGYQDDRHVCLVSGSRGGKGTSSIVNNLVLWPGSICVVDPKGENATITAARRGRGSKNCKGFGQTVRVLDPFQSAQVDDSVRGRFNPLDALDPKNEETIDEAGRIADALVVVHESNDPFWDESARAMVKGLLLHVLTAPQYEGRRNLITLCKLVTRGDWESVETLQAAGEKDIPPAHGLLWTGLANNPAFDGLVAGIGDSFTNMLLNSPKQYESVLQVANRNTEFIDSPAMQRCLEASDFQLGELKTRPEGLSLYLCLPQRYMSTHYRWLRMMISLTVTGMEKVRSRPATGYPILMVLDEFAGLNRMEVIEQAVAQIASYGVKLFFVLQSLEQLKAVYKDNWETFLANSGLKVFFNLEDNFSRDYVSKLIGETEVVREVRSASDSESESQGTNSSVSSGTSRGVNTSRTESKSSSIGESWTPGSWFYLLWRSKENRHLSDGTSWSQSQTEGESRGWTQGRSEGVSQGTSESRTVGTSETIQKRALVTPDEIGQIFARVDDRDRAAYPGLALVVISGARPVALRRVNYYEDAQFIVCFDPPPDYPAQEVRFLRIRGEALDPYFAYCGTLELKWLVKPGQIVSEGEALIGAALGEKTVAFLRSPVHGRIHLHVPDDGDKKPVLGILHYGNSFACDPLAELAAHARKTNAVIGRCLRNSAIWSGVAGIFFISALASLVQGGNVGGWGLLTVTLVVMGFGVKKIREHRAARRIYAKCFPGGAQADSIDSRVYIPGGAAALTVAGQSAQVSQAPIAMDAAAPPSEIPPAAPASPTAPLPRPPAASTAAQPTLSVGPSPEGAVTPPRPSPGPGIAPNWRMRVGIGVCSIFLLAIGVWVGGRRSNVRMTNPPPENGSRSAGRGAVPVPQTENAPTSAGQGAAVVSAPENGSTSAGQGAVPVPQTENAATDVPQPQESSTEWDKLAVIARQGCDGGDMAGCNALGNLYDGGKGVAQDKVRAAALYRQACDGGEYSGCYSLAGMYAIGEGVAKDEAKAATLYRQACDGGKYSACYRLAGMYAIGWGVTEDKAKAVALLRQACDAGAGDGSPERQEAVRANCDGLKRLCEDRSITGCQ